MLALQSFAELYDERVPGDLAATETCSQNALCLRFFRRFPPLVSQPNPTVFRQSRPGMSGEQGDRLSAGLRIGEGWGKPPSPSPHPLHMANESANALTFKFRVSLPFKGLPGRAARPPVGKGQFSADRPPAPSANGLEERPLGQLPAGLGPLLRVTHKESPAPAWTGPPRVPAARVPADRDRIWLYSPAAPSLGWVESRRLGPNGPGRRRSPREGPSRVRDHQGVLAPGLNQLP